MEKGVEEEEEEVEMEGVAVVVMLWSQGSISDPFVQTSGAIGNQDN